MYLIAKQRGGHQAIPIKAGDKWDCSKVLPGRTEVRIVLRVRGRRYLLYHTRDLTARYPALARTQLMPLCDEIIAILSDHIRADQEYIDLDRIIKASECRHSRRWCDHGLIPLESLESYYGHPIDHKAQQLVSYVRVDLDNIIVMDHEPPVDDCKQEDLPY